MKRLATLQPPIDLGAAGTRVIDIDTKDQISAIDIVFTCVNVTVSVMLDWVMACITKIEVVDGGTVLYSATGAQAFGIDAYSNRRLPWYDASLTVGGNFGFAARLNFGRYLWDDDYALRPEVYKNLQLRITHNEAACNTAVIVNSFAAYAHVDSTPQGGNAASYLLTKEVKTYPMAGAAHEYTDLPTDGDMRAVFLQGKTNDHDLQDLIDTLKLDLNTGGSVIFEQSIINLIRTSPLIEVETWTGHGDLVVTAKDIYSCLANCGRLTIEYDETAHVTAQTVFALAVYNGPFIDVSASVDIQADFIQVHGKIPGGVLPIPMGDLQRPETWLNLSAADAFRADVLGLAASDNGDTCALVTQQAIRY